MREDFTPELPCVLNDPDCERLTKMAVRDMALAVWQYTTSGTFSGTSTEKQRLINEGMDNIIRTALGEYSKRIFNATMASLRVEMKDDSRIKDAYMKGHAKSMSPDSCIIPNYKDVGNDFILMYKMNMSSIAKNHGNMYLNMSGEIFEFHRHKGNRDRFLVMMNATPTVNFHPVGKRGLIEPETTRFEDHSERFIIDEEDVPGSLGYRIKTQTIISDLKFDWDPRIIAAMTSKAKLRDALIALGSDSIPIDGVQLHGINDLVTAIIKSYDPVNELNMNDDIFEASAFPENSSEMDDSNFEYPF